MSNESNWNEEFERSAAKQRNNYQGIIGVGLAIAQQDRWQLRELWCSGSLKWLITLADKNNYKVFGIFLSYPHVPASDMQKALTEWMQSLEDKDYLEHAHLEYMDSQKHQT